MKIALENRNENSYSSDYFTQLTARLLVADSENLMSYDDLRKVEKALDDCVISHLKQAIEKNMYYNAKLTKNEKQPYSWIKLTFSDTNITLDISVDKDKKGNYYLLSYDNIRKVENNGDTRFSIVEIQATQDRIKEIATQVFNKFNIVEN